MTDSTNFDSHDGVRSTASDVYAGADVPLGARLVASMGTLLQHRRLVAGLPAALFVLVVGMGLILPRRYSATLAFVPQVSTGDMGNVAGLVASLGVSLPTLDLTQSPDFYTGLVQTDQFLRVLVDGPYVIPTDDDTLRGSLVALYHLDDDRYLRSRELAVEALRDHFLVRADAKNGMVRITANAKYPALAYQIVERALDEIDRFNTMSRHEHAGQEREFIARRLVEAQHELQTASDSEIAFLEANRSYQNSPELTFEHDRLDRVVGMRTDLYTQLAGKYDQARIEEARATPRITIVEHPIFPPRPDKRGLLLKGILAMLAGFVLAIFVVYIQESIALTRIGDPDGVQRLVIGWRDMRADVREFAARGRGLIRRRSRS